ncbi:hypothetical protein BN946_scf184851.g13 [Trametes cinnabarina]|uniref:Uncharacterized protein n=1 Tax=Pycnoporus cinnabarinus TaxID=5643 RepID=A0A060S5J7_PYCCI|nr:hypothetical protein BN946_scf184851.g13 [Trametes cinnabarina]
MPSNRFAGLTRVSGKKRHRPTEFDKSSSPSLSPSPLPPTVRSQPPAAKSNTLTGSKPKKDKKKRKKAKHTQETGLSSPEPSKEAHTPDMPDHNAHVVRAYKALDPRAKLVTRLGASYEHMYQAARMLPQYIGAFVDYETVLTKGLARDGTYRFNNPDYVRRQVYLCAYIFSSAHFPGISDHLEYLHEDTDVVGQLAEFKYIYEIAGWKDDLLKIKAERGFKHIVTGRLLCPASLLDQFDRDPQGFCRAVRDQHDERPWVTGDDWPAFVYDMDEYTPDDVMPGLFKNKLLLKCYKLVFTGPASVPIVGSTHSGKPKGKPPVIKNMADAEESVNVYSILYIACLVQHALSDQPEWVGTDIDFTGREFVQTVLTLACRNVNWQADITEWYIKRVLRNSSKREPPAGRQTAYAKMLMQTSGGAQPSDDALDPENEEEDGQGDENGGEEDAKGEDNRDDLEYC